MRDLPEEIRFHLGKYRILLCHGSPRRMNEFLWESTTSTHFLEKLTRDYDADIICATHTGIHWHRELAGDTFFVNVGVIGRPENDGKTCVGYTIIEIDERPIISYIPVEYDYNRLAHEMREEGLPEEFIELNPYDADNLGVQDGNKVRVSSRRGTVDVTARVTERVQKGLVFMAFHFAESCANVLTNNVFDPVADTAEYKCCAVKVESLNGSQAKEVQQ